MGRGLFQLADFWVDLELEGREREQWPQDWGPRLDFITATISL